MDAYFCTIDGITRKQLKPYEHFLPQERLLKAQNCLRDYAYCQTVCSFLLLGQVICSRLNLSIDSLCFSIDRYGKPYIDNAEIDFSISHTKGAVACMIDHVCAGIDVESTLRTIGNNLWERFFCKEEIEYINSCADKSSAFIRLWTSKEAYLKALGTGLTRSLSSFSILPSKEGYRLTDSFSDKLELIIRSASFEDYTVSAVGTSDFDIVKIDFNDILNFYK